MCMGLMCVGSPVVFGWCIQCYPAAKLQLLWWCFHPQNITSIPGWHEWQKYIGFCSNGCFFFFSSFFPLSFSVLESTPVYFQSNLSIYFSFRFDLCSFCCYLSYLRLSKELQFSFNLIFLWLFYFSDLVLVVFIFIF